VLARAVEVEVLKRYVLRALQLQYKDERERAERKARDASVAVQLVLRVEPPRAGQMTSLVKMRPSSLLDFGLSVLQHLVAVAAPLLFSQPIAHGCSGRRGARRSRAHLPSSRAHPGQELLRHRRQDKRVLRGLLARFRAPATASHTPPTLDAQAGLAAGMHDRNDRNDRNGSKPGHCALEKEARDGGGSRRKTLEGLLEQARRFVSGVELQSDAPIVLVQGVAGSGRTSLLAQFVHEMASNKQHRSLSVAVGSGANATIAHGVRVPVGAALFPEHLFAGLYLHREAIAVQECVCVAALRHGAGTETMWLPAALHRIVTQLSVRAVRPGGPRPVGPQHPHATHTHVTGSVEELVQAVEEALVVLRKRIVVVIDGLLFNEAVYLSTKLAVLCQPAGHLCRKAFFVLSCNMPGPDESLVAHMDSSSDGDVMRQESAVEWGSRDLLARHSNLTTLHSHRGCYLSSHVCGHAGAARGGRARLSSVASATAPGRATALARPPDAASKRTRPSTAGSGISTAWSRPSTSSSHLEGGREREEIRSWYMQGRPSSHYRVRSPHRRDAGQAAEETTFASACIAGLPLSSQMPAKDRLRHALAGFPLNLPALAHMGGQGAPASGFKLQAAYAIGHGARLRALYQPVELPDQDEPSEEYSQRLVYAAARALVLSTRGGASDAASEAMRPFKDPIAGERKVGIKVLEEGHEIAMEIKGFVPVDQLPAQPLIKVAPVCGLEIGEAVLVLEAALLARGMSNTTLLTSARLFIASASSGLPGASSPLYLDMLANMLSQMPLQQALVALATDAQDPDKTFPRCLNGPHGMCQPVLKRLEKLYGPLVIQCTALSLCRMGGCTQTEASERVKSLFLARNLRIPTVADMSDIMCALRQFTTSRDSFGQCFHASATLCPLSDQRLVIHDAFKDDVITLYTRGSWHPSVVSTSPVRVCCLLVLNSVTSTPQWIRQPEAVWGNVFCFVMISNACFTFVTVRQLLLCLP
jgi:hypothetical protein